MTQVAVAADSIGMTIPLHNPNENDLVCQGQFTSEDLRISGDGIERIPLSNLSQSIEEGSKSLLRGNICWPLFPCAITW
jgi:hypothetical protein